MKVSQYLPRAVVEKTGLDIDKYKYKFKPHLNKSYWEGPCPICGTGKTRFNMYVHGVTGQHLYKCSKCGFAGEIKNLASDLVKALA